MSQALMYTLLALALVLPIVGALALRFLSARLDERAVAVVATLLVGVALASVFVLARSDIRELRLGNLTLLFAPPRNSDTFQLPPNVIVDEAPPDATPATEATMPATPSAANSAMPTANAVTPSAAATTVAPSTTTAPASASATPSAP